jgi:hypothetical protein
MSGNVIPLNELKNFKSHELQDLIRQAPRPRDLRSTIRYFIKSIHGLPEVMKCDIRQIKVYVGRAGATSTHLRQRWKVRFEDEEFAKAPSTHAMVVAQAPTQRIQDNNWESIALRFATTLDRNDALCCANAIVGSSGRFPETDDSVLYLVARIKQGPIGNGAQVDKVNNFIREVQEDNNIPDGVARDARLVANPQEAAPLQLMGPSWWTDDNGEFCKKRNCLNPALPGSRGYCGWCR